MHWTCLLIAALWAPPESLPAGFGATRGAAAAPGGEQVVHVTTLADNRPGTLRDAISAPGRRVVFDVAGEIVLRNDLLIRVPYLTIDGATAPAPGITLRQTGVTTAIEASRTLGAVHDVIARPISFPKG